LTNVLVDIQFFDKIDEDSDPVDALCSFVLTHLRYAVLRQVALKPLASTARLVLSDRFGEGFVTRLNAELQLVLDATCTQDAVDLALRIRDFLEAEKEDLKDQQNATDTASASDDADTDSDTSGNSESDDSDTDGDDASNACDASSPVDELDADDESTDALDDGADFSESACADDDSDSSSDNDERGDTTSSATTDTDDDAPSEQSDGVTQQTLATDDVEKTIDALEDVLTAIDLDPNDGDLGESLAELLEDHVDHQPGLTLVLPTDDIRVEGGRDPLLVSQARRTASRLSVQLQRVLSSENLVDRIMVTRSYEEATDTALVFLVDVSHSMSGKVELAAHAALATSLSLSPIAQLAHAIGAFPSQNGASQVELVRDFHETTEMVGTRFRLSVRGNTPMSEALLWATDRLVGRQERRKIICVATDGKPNDTASTQQVLSKIRRLGIESHCLGINTPDTGLFDSFAEVDAVEKLAKVYLTLFQKLLRKTA